MWTPIAPSPRAQPASGPEPLFLKTGRSGLPNFAVIQSEPLRSAKVRVGGTYFIDAKYRYVIMLLASFVKRSIHRYR
jgi:N-formylglutamate amidohydrolase